MSFAAWLGAIIGGTATAVSVEMILIHAGVPLDGESRFALTFPMYLFGALIGGACGEIIFGRRR